MPVKEHAGALQPKVHYVCLTCLQNQQQTYRQFILQQQLYTQQLQHQMVEQTKQLLRKEAVTQKKILGCSSQTNAIKGKKRKRKAGDNTSVSDPYASSCTDVSSTASNLQVQNLLSDSMSDDSGSDRSDWSKNAPSFSRRPSVIDSLSGGVYAVTHGSNVKQQKNIPPNSRKMHNRRMVTSSSDSPIDSHFVDVGVSNVHSSSDLLHSVSNQNLLEVTSSHHLSKKSKSNIQVCSCREFLNCCKQSSTCIETYHRYEQCI